MHRKFILICFAFLIHLQQGYTQNLVPNPGFELLTDSTFLTPSGVQNVPYWFGLEGSTDFFHMDLPDPWSIPTNLRGTQSPASGNGAAGIFSGPNLREFLAVKLMDTLEEGQIYRISMQVNLSNLSQKSTDDLGIVFLDSNPLQDSINHY